MARRSSRDKKATRDTVGPAPAKTRAVALPWDRLLCVLVLVGAGLAVYANSFQAPLVFDDLYSIRDNPNIRALWPLSEALSAPPDLPVAGRPVVCLSLAVNYALGGLDVWGYHAVNLAVHLAAGCLLFGLVRMTLAHGRYLDVLRPAATLLAFGVALLWVVHPLQTEAVTYITQRTELIMGLFFLATMYAAARAHDSPCPWAWQAAAVVACALGMASKEVMAAAPLLVVLYDRAFRYERWRDLWARRYFYLALAGTWIILAVMIATVPRGLSVGFRLGASPWQYAVIQCWAIGRYLWLSVWPVGLVFDYGHFDFFWPSLMRRGWTVVLPGAAAIGLLLAATVWGWLRWPPLGFLGAWIFLILAPSSSIVPIVTEVAAERRMYLPLAAVVSCLVLGGEWLIRSAIGRSRTSPPERSLFTWVTVAVGLIVVAWILGVAAMARNHDYRSVDSIWQDAIDRAPENPRPYRELARELLANGRTNEAIRYLQEAIEIAPHFTDAQIDLAVIEADAGRVDQALARCRDVLVWDPHCAQAHNNIGVYLLRRNQSEEARQHFEKALEIHPTYVEAIGNLGAAYARLQHWDEAEKQFQAAIAAAPRSPRVYMNAAEFMAMRGNYAEARRHAQKVLELMPGDARAMELLEVLKQPNPQFLWPTP